MNETQQPTAKRIENSATPRDSASLDQALRAIAGVTAFAVLTALAAQVAIPLPFTPVPVTLQTLVVLLAGVTLGPRLGTASMTFYLLLGATGYSVFALGSWASGGYLLGFLLAQPAVGLLSRGGGPQRVLVALLAGNAIIFACGVPWLAFALQVDAPAAVSLGLLPFVPGMLLKTAAALALGVPAARYLRPRLGS